jgi:putative FmdB family regulatory protein
MPIYEYRCTACGHEVEVIQKMGDARLRKCDRCSGRLEKLVSRAAFQLRGGGWYSEGYAKSDPDKSKKKEAKSESGTSSSESKGGSGESSTDPGPRKAASS